MLKLINRVPSAATTFQSRDCLQVFHIIYTCVVAKRITYWICPEIWRVLPPNPGIVCPTNSQDQLGCLKARWWTWANPCNFYHKLRKTIWFVPPKSCQPKYVYPWLIFLLYIASHQVKHLNILNYGSMEIVVWLSHSFCDSTDWVCFVPIQRSVRV